MGDWSFLGRLLTEVQNHSTVIGKIWLTALLIFRILLVTLVGDAVYGDEQSKFTCNTLQPGCTNVCYNSFAPISHLRFWIFQIVLVATPSIFYIVCVLHQVALEERLDVERDRLLELWLRQEASRQAFPGAGSGGLLPSISLQGQSAEEEEEEGLPRLPDSASQDPVHLANRVLIIYIAHVVLRSFLELGFLVGQYYLFGFDVPHLFRCETYPCPTQTDCFVSRATEKMIFLNFMFGVGLGCFFLNLAELHYLGWLFTFRMLFRACVNCCQHLGKASPPHGPRLLPLLDSSQQRMLLEASLLPAWGSGHPGPQHTVVPVTLDAGQAALEGHADRKSTKEKPPKMPPRKKSWL
ncbi:gap junction delta-2 protein-like [Antechinus flavipes]|uniref:gap junction delta-2 protein-like n=1 Tax=Antechinus flavipes TaxID=38775 RepID=UPI0022369461|nr:gap junction delta-2 protein-like [Antechinus flavipes]